MAKFFSYFPVTIALMLGAGIIFYVITTEPPLFFKKSAEKGAYSVLPKGDTKPVNFLNESEEEQEEVKSPDMETLPKQQSPLQPRPAPSPPEEKIPERVPEEEPVPQIHLVSMEADGFKPRTLIVRAGDTVRWINNDSALHWPASDPHPTHTGLLGLDPLADVLPNESYSFQFNELGVYGYHDHTQAVVSGVATLTAIVRVVEK